MIELDQVLKPSACIESLFRSNDLVCLLNHGRELETGRTFGRIVVSHIKNPEEKPLIQIERRAVLTVSLFRGMGLLILMLKSFQVFLN
jgi:hypothetical protein